MIVGALAHTVGTFMTLRSAFGTVESTCHMLDSLIDKHIDINTVSPFFINSKLVKVKLRSKSERQVWFAFEEVLYEYSRDFLKDHGKEVPIQWTQEGIDAALRGRHGNVVVGVLKNMGTCLFRYAIGDVAWINDPDTVYVREWIAKKLTHEHRMKILQAVILFDDVAEDNRLS
jgi:hypothetical protein